MAVDDVADVLSALQYPSVNLYGGSYGATAPRRCSLAGTPTLCGR
jgi:hypothetical protein